MIPLVWCMEVVAVKDEDDHGLSARPGGDEDRLKFIVQVSVTLLGRPQVNFIASE